MVREDAARELGDSGNPRSVRYLIACLGDPSPTVSLATVNALERLGDPSAVMPLYELVQNETADGATRRAAARALVKFGLLRRERAGPSAMFLWLAGLAGVIVAAGAASTLGPAAIVLFVAGVGALGYYYLRQLGQRRGVEEVYIGPRGERIRMDPGGTPGGERGSDVGGGWFGGWGHGDGGGGNGGGGNGGGA